MPQSLSNVLLHIIFSTKDRKKLIGVAIEPQLYAYITGIASSSGSYIHAIGGTDDHIHILATLPRTLTIAAFLETIKKHSSKWIKTKGPQYNIFAWQRGFGTFSVSQSLFENVVNYLSRQKEHHKTICFKQEFIEFLQKNKISYDERYVWD